MKKLLTVAGIVALAGIFAAGPAIAADTVRDKADRAADKADTKAQRAADKVEDKADRAGDKAADKADTAGGKIDRGVSKVKEKAREVKDKFKSKTTDKTASSREGAGDVRATQQALRDKGFDPGPVDGRMGPRTRAALSDYQKKENLKVTGRMDAETADKLGVAHPAASPGTSTGTPKQAGS